MPHFLIEKEQIKDDLIVLLDDDNFSHLTRALRVKTGESVKFIDRDKTVYLTVVVEIKKKSLKAKIIKTRKTERILKSNICLVQCILMNDAQNLLIANAAQTGVKEVYPVISDNTSVSFNSPKNKMEKWEKIALESFKQCERGDCVKINKISKLKEALLNFEKENIIIYAEKDTNISVFNAVKNLDKNKKTAVVIGPEGGFSDEEFDYFKKEKYNLVSLGPMIYKAPNAVVAGVYAAASLLENYE